MANKANLYCRIAEMLLICTGNLWNKNLRKKIIPDKMRSNGRERSMRYLKSVKSNLQNDLMDRTITPQYYQDMKGRVEKDRVLIKDKLTDLQQQTSLFKI